MFNSKLSCAELLKERLDTLNKINLIKTKSLTKLTELKHNRVNEIKLTWWCTKSDSYHVIENYDKLIAIEKNSFELRYSATETYYAGLLNKC